jgi:hypothetical protein
MNRKEEAATEWLTVRGHYAIVHDSEQLDKLLQTLETKITQYVERCSLFFCKEPINETKFEFVC